MYFSKSMYCQLWRCPKLLWLETFSRQVKTPEPSGDDRLTAGIEVGQLARGLFGEYADVTVQRADGSPDIAAMIEATKVCIDNGTANICEASFSYEGLYCAVDILRKEHHGYAIYEVKSAAHEAQIYGADIAYQKYVLEHCGISVTGTYLVCINTDYVRQDDLQLSQLFRIIDMTDLAEAETPAIAERLAAAKQILNDPAEPNCDLSERCDDPYHCPYWEYCSRHLPKPSVFDLYRLPAKKKLDCYRKGFSSFQSLLDNVKLNEKQLRQVRYCLQDSDMHIDKAGIREFLGTLSYPIYFLDFETMQCAIPPFSGSRPYQQIPFQYSLHYVEVQGGEICHREFLAESGRDPRRAIAESLCRDIPENACITVYNKTFECGRLKELAEQFPDLSESLMNMRSNIRDLIVPFQSGYVYNREMGGSFSIKSVLPALFPDDPELNYHNLKGVQNGSEAMSLYPKLQDMPLQEREAARKGLLEYCRLDTWAMVKIWQMLQKLAE